jgi:hypothetical protein
MITAVGLDVDATMIRFLERAIAEELPVRFVNLRAAVRGEWHFDLPPAAPAELRFADVHCRLDPGDSYYCRLIDLSSSAETSRERKRWRALVRAFDLWLSAVPGVVANRPSAGHDNSSKPLHGAALAAFDFRVPDTITSSSPERLLAFAADGPTISKAVCGVRADSALVSEEQLRGFQPEQGPILLQRYVAGADARIHVVGDSLVAQRIVSGGVDYRRDADFDDLERFDPPDELAQQLIRTTKALDLEFAGWDFKIDAAGDYWCLEVNPMPGYNPYDHRCDGAISSLLLGRLAGGRLT